MIGDDIEITVVDIRGDKIRLGIDAPTDIAVHRKEVYDAIRRENEQAAQLEVGEIGQFRITPAKSERNPSTNANIKETKSKTGLNRSGRRRALRGPRSAQSKKSDSTHCSSKTA